MEKWHNGKIGTMAIKWNCVKLSETEEGGDIMSFLH